MIDDFELNARQRKIAQLMEAQSRDTNRMAELAKLKDLCLIQDPAGVELLRRFRETGDVVWLRDEFGVWGKQTGHKSFSGVNGQMFLNQLVKYSPDHEVLARLLARCLPVPGSPEAAAKAINDLAEFAASIKVGIHPTPRRSIFFLSFFWSVQLHSAWPCFWTSAERMLIRLGWLQSSDDLGQLYLNFRDTVRGVGDPDDVEHVLHYLESQKFLGLDPSLTDRCKRAIALVESRVEGAYPDEVTRRCAEVNAKAIVGELGMLGEALAEPVATAIGRSVKNETPSLFWDQAVGCYRGDGWVRWAITDEGAGPSGARGAPPISIRVWATAGGTYVGLHPGFYRTGGYVEAGNAVRDVAPSAAIPLAVSKLGSRVDPQPDDSWQSEVQLGWRLDTDISAEEISNEIVRRSAELQPALDRLVSLIGGRPRPDTQSGTDPLKAKVEQFIVERSYPSARDDSNRADRVEMAAALAPEEVRIMDIDELKRIYGSNRYGSPGPMSILHTTLKAASPAELEDYLDRIHFLLWGEGDDADRIDELLDQHRRWIRGLGESSIMKLFAIVNPNRYVPIFPYGGDNGKFRMMKLLSLAPPPDGLTAGHRQVAANDSIRARLDPFFPNDPWGQAQFCYWLSRRTETPTQNEADVLAALADDLLVGREFISEVVELLREKGQVVFYGPPGTGKTFVARALAKALATDQSRRAIVQFHPSTSYEDFFEGYRPEESDGQLTYQLRKGPLAMLAERAEANPGVAHVLVIDELNRANLPKVFGELLYLLEYRNDQVQTLYRPDEHFSLPDNLYVIGTMNTADRSIALVDAALRRRFHFIPFFPDDGEMEGLLRRWLERFKQPVWIAEFVEYVNTKLVEEMGGPDLQLGPSYFMRIGVEQELPRIWKYNIEPLIQDQLFGQPEKIRAFTYTEIHKSYRLNAEPEAVSVAVDE